MSHGAPTPRAYVLLHGLTASPRQFEAFGRTLFQRGSNVYVPRLPRHGLADRLTPELALLTADELREFAAAAIARGRGLGERVVCVGFSVGGLLSAWIGQHHAIERATAIAPFLGPAFVPGGLARGAMRASLLLPNRFVWWNPILRERQMPAHGYPRVPTHAVAHAGALARELLASARASAPAAKDLQIVLNASESTVNNAAARRLAAAWSAHRGGANVLHRLQGLPPSHDIIEPLRSPAIVSRVYPQLFDLVER